jgi:hypothetical protein
MKTRYFAALILAIFFLMTPLLYAVRARKSSSDFGSNGQYTSQTFGYPPVQYPNGTITTSEQTTVEVCNDTNAQCESSHAFIYKFQLPDGDPGTVTSLTLTVNATAGAIFSQSPSWGVITCAENGSPAPCSDPNATLTACAESTTVNESGIGTPTYSQTWTFAGCSQPFVAGQSLAIFISLCTPANTCNDSQENPSPVIDYQDGAGVLVSVGVSRPAQFVPVTPCRLVDTRLDGGPIWGGTSRDFIVPDLGGCNIPSNATAYSLNVTVVPDGYLEFLTVFPTGEGQPVVSTLNSHDGRVKANAAIVPAGDQDSVSVYVFNTANVVLDIDGYFAPPSASTMQFYPLPPCRVVDTRSSDYPPGLGSPSLSAQMQRDFPVLESPCFANIPNTAQAYSFNFTALPPMGTDQPLEYLTVWPKGSQKPLVSTLNNPTATTVANAAIVPAGDGGDIDVFATDNTDLLIDVNGYFAIPPQGGQAGLSLYSVYPCRVLDTRPPSGNGPFSGLLTVDVLNTTCAPSNQAQSYVFSATVVPPGPMGYLTLWPDGSSQPTVSTLNAYDGEVTSNLAIVPAGNQGKIDVFASGLTNLLLDIYSYFAP